jgi:isochorismate synthase
MSRPPFVRRIRTPPHGAAHGVRMPARRASTEARPTTLRVVPAPLGSFERVARLLDACVPFGVFDGLEAGAFVGRHRRVAWLGTTAAFELPQGLGGLDDATVERLRGWYEALAGSVEHAGEPGGHEGRVSPTASMRGAPLVVLDAPFEPDHAASLLLPTVALVEEAGGRWLQLAAPLRTADGKLPRGLAAALSNLADRFEPIRLLEQLEALAARGPSTQDPRPRTRARWPDAALDRCALLRSPQDPNAARFLEGVRRALEAIAAGRLVKVVLSRSLALDPQLLGPPSALLTVRSARHPGPYGFVRALGTPDDRTGERLVVGASPELLVERRGRVARSSPLAGTVALRGDPSADERALRRLLASTKERWEHDVVVSWVRTALEEICDGRISTSEPRVLRLRGVAHLATSIEADLRARPRRLSEPPPEEDPALDLPGVVELAARLHPTPAVAGIPLGEALALIASVEAAPRGRYAGVTGWADCSGDGELAIALRCGVLAEDRLELRAGAGIVAGSDPELELEETAAKLAATLDSIVA